MNIIEVKNLSKTYFTDDVATPVLHDLSFSVKAGEFVAVMGPSGSGKSTLLHIMGFLDSQTEGVYLFDGKRMEDYSDDELAHIRNEKMGFVFQAFNLLPRATVYENVRLPLLYSAFPESEWHNRVVKAIEAVGLSHRLNYTATQLSGGEKQRVAIARALISEPKVIFADEPTGNLDSKAGQSAMAILKKLNKEEGHTIILITHETDIAHFAERIIYLKDGRIFSDTKKTK